MARGGHGLPKVSLGPAMPYQSALYRWPPWKQPYSCFIGGRPQDRRPAAVFYSLGHPMPHVYTHAPCRMPPYVQNDFDFFENVLWGKLSSVLWEHIGDEFHGQADHVKK
jgi:hypothetical protein